ncbi:Flavonoid 3',5'-hydroxylase 1-like protein [Drosera capensis]
MELLLKLLTGTIVCILTRLIIKQILAWPQDRETPPLPPGPKGWPVLGCLPLLGKTPHVALARLSRTFGPIMYLKLGTCNVVVASNPVAAKAFLKTLDHSFVNRPLGAGPNYIAYDASDMVFAEFGPRWKLLRKLANLHMLGATSFGEWATLRRTEIGHMVRDMCAMSRAGERVPVLEYVSCALANVIGKKCISRRVFASHGEESNDFKNMIVELMRLAGLFNIGDFIPWMEPMDLQGIQGKMKRLHDKFDVLITEMLEEHVKTTSEREGNPDFFDVVMGIKGDVDGVKLTLTNYKALLLNMFIAGTDTSSCTIEWAMAEMLKNPTIFAHLQAEIDDVIGKNRRLEESDISKLPFLQAVCKETFRKHPVVPLNIPRMTNEPCHVNGYYIPKNTRLFVNVWAMGRDPELWENPLVFDPNRFMSKKGQQIEPWGNDFELIPFGSGRRICAGIRMGIVMVQFVVGTLVHSFDWKIDDGSKIEMDEAFGLVLGKAERLKAIVTPRLEPAAYKD